jgi:hypothetical protein
MTATRATPLNARAGLVICNGGSAVHAGDAQALILSDTPIGENENEFVALVFNTKDGRRIWLENEDNHELRSLVRLPGSWIISEYLAPIDFERMKKADPGGLNRECIASDRNLAPGTLCQCCGQEVPIYCSCWCECENRVEEAGDTCSKCDDECNESDDDEPDEEYCDVCEEDGDHPTDSHDYCDTCDRYAAHETKDCPNKPEELVDEEDAATV